MIDAHVARQLPGLSADGHTPAIAVGLLGALKPFEQVPGMALAALFHAVAPAPLKLVAPACFPYARFPIQQNGMGACKTQGGEVSWPAGTMFRAVLRGFSGVGLAGSTPH